MATLKESLAPGDWGCHHKLLPHHTPRSLQGSFPSREESCVLNSVNCSGSQWRRCLTWPGGERVRILFKVVPCSLPAFQHLGMHHPAVLVCSALDSPGLRSAWDKAPFLPRVGHFNSLVDAHGSAHLRQLMPLSSSFSGTALLTYPLPDFLSHPGTKHVLYL